MNYLRLQNLILTVGSSISSEADYDCIARSSISVDHEGATKETGELVMPLANGTIAFENIKSNLFELCQGFE